MRIDRNISYFKDSDLPYQIAIERKNIVLHESFNSLEDAIAAKDEVEQTYNLTKELKHSSRYEDHLKLSACERFGTNEIVKITSEGSSKYRYDAIAKCDECGKESKYIEVRFYKAFLSRDRLCQSCHMKTRTEEIAERLRSRKEPNSTNRTTGVKNICYDAKKKLYIFSIRRKDIRYARRFNDLNRAIEHKSQVLRFYKENHRLPSRDEI